jgi:hypothetical protein
MIGDRNLVIFGQKPTVTNIDNDPYCAFDTKNTGQSRYTYCTLAVILLMIKIEISKNELNIQC